VLGRVINVDIIPQIVKGFEEKEVIAGRVKLEMLGFAKCVKIDEVNIEIAFKIY